MEVRNIDDRIVSFTVKLMFTALLTLTSIAYAVISVAITIIEG